MPMLQDAEERLTSYEAVYAYTSASYPLLGEGPAQAVPGGFVSPAHVEVLGSGPTWAAGSLREMR